MSTRLEALEDVAMHARCLAAHLDILLASRRPGEPDSYVHLTDLRASLAELEAVEQHEAYWAQAGE